MNGLLISAGINGVMGVAALAAGAHALKARLPEASLERFLQAGQIQLWHAIVLVALAALTARLPGMAGTGNLAGTAGWTITAGLILFSGSLYWLAFKGTGGLGGFHWLTPLGGLVLMAGWGMILVAGLKAGS